MSTAFAEWMTAHRTAVIAEWSGLLSEPLSAPLSNGSDNNEAVATLPGALVSVEQLFDALVLASGGDRSALELQLRGLGEGDDGSEPALNSILSLSFELRRSIRRLTKSEQLDPTLALTIVDELDELFEYTSAVIVNSWSAHTVELIREREFIAESLDAASAAADQRALQLKALNDISQRLSASLDADPLLDLVVSSLDRLTGIAHIAVWLPTTIETRPGLIVAHASGVDAEQIIGTPIELSADGDLVVEGFRSGKVQFEMNPDAEAQGAWYQHGCGVLILPMLVNDQSIGVVTLQDSDPVQQLRLQQDLAQGVIGQAAIALQNARLYSEVRTLNADLEQRVEERTRELQEEKDRLATIHEISTEVSSTLDLNMLLKTSLEVLVGITQAEHASIMLVEEDDSSLLVTRAVHGVPANPGNYTRFPIGAGIAGWAAQNRKSALVNDVSQDERWVSIPGGSRKREGAMISVPLVVQGQVLGVLTLSHRQTSFFHDGHMRLLNACAGAIAIGINNANLFQMISTEFERRSELLSHQQKEASQIAAILQSLADGVIVCDLYGSVLTANPASANILQRSLEELLLWNLHDILARYLGPRSIELPLNTLLSQPLNSASQPRMFNTTSRFGLRMVSLSLGPVLKDDGELLGALLVVRDITREVEADRLKTEFIGTMSHELRTPMTAIKGFTQLLAMGGLGPLNDTQREFVSTIHSNTERMISLINDVLDITKIESGSVDLELRSLHLAEALSGVMAELQGPIAQRNHELSISIPPGLPLVRADAHRLHQILYNLISNAVKYTTRGGRIWVEAFEARLDSLPEYVREGLVADKRYVQVNIRDTGIGISAEDMSRIFDRFYRTENPLKIEAGGTGLGLSLVRPLVQLLGGKVWAESVLDEGSTFSFVLPTGVLG